MSKTKDIPFSRMHIISESGVFVKHFRRAEKTAMKSYAHRDDYYMIVLLTDGYARVEVDLEKLELKSGEILVVSPWQVHGKPTGENWDADGWLLGFSPEILSEKEIRTAEEYSISPRPFSTDGSTTKDIVALCVMLEKNKDNESIAGALGAAVKSIVMASLVTTDKDAANTTGRYGSTYHSDSYFASHQSTISISTTRPEIGSRVLPETETGQRGFCGGRFS
ncbi:MAG: hypothetical protein J6J93_06255 [Muribaculaceae bacterium]|nr:hypothetical protein [Muribaculaceae bacterium]